LQIVQKTSNLTVPQVYFLISSTLWAVFLLSFTPVFIQSSANKPGGVTWATSN